MYTICHCEEFSRHRRDRNDGCSCSTYRAKCCPINWVTTNEYENKTDNLSLVFISNSVIYFSRDAFSDVLDGQDLLD